MHFPFQARSQSCEKRLLASSCLSVRLSARMQQFGSNWTDFMKFYIWVFKKKNREYLIFIKI